MDGEPADGAEASIEAAARVTAEFIAGEVPSDDVTIFLNDEGGGCSPRYTLTRGAIKRARVSPHPIVSGREEQPRRTSQGRDDQASPEVKAWEYPLVVGSLNLGYVRVALSEALDDDHPAQRRLHDLAQVGAQSIYAAHKEHRVREETPAGYEQFFLH